jgi:hypothetical protein
MGATTTQLIEADTSTGARIPAFPVAILHGLTTARSKRTIGE